MLTLLAAAVLATSAPTDLVRLGDASLGEGLPPGWMARRVSGSPLPTYSVREDDGQLLLHVEGMGAAGWAYRELAAPIGESAGVLRWSWRVLELPSGADLRVREKDDAALRLCVVFGKPGGLGAAGSRIIFYTWGNAEPSGLSRESFASAKFRIVRVAGAMEAGREWHQQEVAPFEDYRRFWDREPGPITAIGLMQDTDMTGAMAVSELRSLVWEER